MDCKFLDSYEAELDGSSIDVWYCRKRDPFVLGPTREVALRTCSSCRLSDHTRPPSELANEVERRNQELVALNAIVSAVNSSLDLSTVLNTGLDKAIEILQVEAGWIALASDEALDLALHRGVSDEYARAMSTLTAQEGVVGLVAREQQTVVIDDVAGNGTLPLAAAEGLATVLATPLKAQGRLLGVMAVATRAQRSYSADDIYFVSSAGAQLASAIEHALLFREQIDRVERERRLLQAVETVNRSLGTHAVSTTVVAEAARLMNTTKAALLVQRDDRLVAEDVHNLSAEFRRLFVLPLDDSVSGRAIRDGAPVAVDDVEIEPLADAAISAAGGYRAFLTAPLQSSKGTYGALSVFFERPRRFSDDDLTILATFASQATVALENQRLIREKDVLARTDGLTGVFNRSYLELSLDQTMRSLHRNGGLVSLLFIDVDDLKTVNDQRGHMAGDRVLRDLARLLAESCRETDTVARYGGDEFVVLMPDTDARGARQVLSKIDGAIEQRNEADDTEVPLRASMGLQTSGWSDPEELLLAADRSMYEMKRRRTPAAPTAETAPPAEGAQAVVQADDKAPA
ncbi:MAG TPA: diguanylate cyclase [Thermoleophilia bacterium]|nr:diguanylate cyclase [Thermoleophilia bacterium]